MSEATLPQYIEEYDDDLVRDQRVAERRRRFTASIDFYLVLTVSVLVAIGLMMVWSTTFYWAKPQSAIFLQQVRNAVIGLITMLVLGMVDYHIWRRLAIPLMAVIIIAIKGIASLRQIW